MEPTQSDTAGIDGERRLTFNGLPERIKPEDMVTEIPATDAQDPEMGRDTQRDFMFRYLG
ncbi:MAG: hypothetical protein WC054_06175 [Candidatus Nanopelagicales bacterium]